jgi:hypothetical protein
MVKDQRIAARLQSVRDLGSRAHERLNLDVGLVPGIVAAVVSIQVNDGAIAFILAGAAGDAGEGKHERNCFDLHFNPVLLYIDN